MKIPRFSELFPVSMALHSNRIFLARLKMDMASQLRRITVKNRKWLIPWLPFIPGILLLETVKKRISLEHRCARRSERLSLAIFLKENSTIIGEIALHTINWGISFSGGIGYWIDKDFTGKGFAREAIATFACFAFEGLGLHRLWASVQPQNSPSIRVLEILGFKNEGMHRKELFIDGKWQDHFHFSILDEEYPNLVLEWAKKGWLGGEKL